MLSYTNDFNTAIRATDRNIRGYLQFNGDSTKVVRDIDGLVSFKVTQDAMGAERFCIGSANSAYCEATFYNSYIPAGISLANSYFDAYIGVTLADNSVEYKCMGRFYIAEISRGKQTTAVTGYDVVSRLSVNYTPTVTAGANGYEVIDILNDIIDQTQVNGGTHFTTTGQGVFIDAIVEGTCKEQWGWCMALCENYGAVWSGSRVVSDLGYVDGRAYENGKNSYTNYPAINDTVVYLDGLTIGDSFTINSLTTGTDENPIVSGSGVGVNNYNPYINQTQADAIFANLDGVTYYPISLRFRGDPCIEIMDSLKVTQNGTDYRCVVMKIETTFNGGLEQTISCWGDSEAFYVMSRGALESKVKTNSTMLEEMAEAIENASNGVITKILDTDGSWKELVIANNQDLSQATSVWRFNINGLAHANAYSGGTYTLAMDTQGRIVASVIQTGILQDAAAKNSWNLDTGAFSITDGTINIQTNSETYDVIQLNSGGWHNRIAPLGWRLTNDGDKSCLLGQSGAIFGYTNYGEQTQSLSLYLSYTGAIRGNNVSVYDGTYTRGLLNLNGLYLNNSSGTEQVRLTPNGNTGGYMQLYGTAGGKMVLASADAATGGIRLYDDSEKLRTLYDKDGLTFYNASGTTTAYYPATKTSANVSSAYTNKDIAFSRAGNTVTMYLRDPKSLASWDWTDFGYIIPVGFRPYAPSGQIEFDASEPDGNKRVVRITLFPNGQMRIYNYSSYTGTFNISATITYAADD